MPTDPAANVRDHDLGSQRLVFPPELDVTPSSSVLAATYRRGDPMVEWMEDTAVKREGLVGCIGPREIERPALFE